MTLPPTNDLHWLSLGTLWAGVIVGLVSGAQYFRAGAAAATSMSRD